MLIQCPDCRSNFRIGAGQLALTRGRAKCKRCHADFKLLLEPLEVGPEIDARSLPANEENPVSALQTAYSARSQAIAASPPARESTSASMQSAETVEQRRPHASPKAVVVKQIDPGEGSTDARATISSLSSQPLVNKLGIVNLVLTAVLAWQLVCRPAAGLIHSSLTIVSVAEVVCKLVGCDAPLASLPSAMKLDKPAVVAADAQIPDVLAVRLSVVNAAPVRQYFPLVALTLFDQNNRPVGYRRFRPAEYAQVDASTLSGGLAPNRSTAIRIDLVTTATPPDHYEFRFF